jgi:hypothetical protein
MGMQIYKIGSYSQLHRKIESDSDKKMGACEICGK